MKLAKVKEKKFTVQMSAETNALLEEVVAGQVNAKSYIKSKEANVQLSIETLHAQMKRKGLLVKEGE